MIPASPLAITLDQLGDLVDAVRTATGATGTEGVTLQLAGMAFHVADKVVRTLDAAELERIQKLAAQQSAAGQAAWEASHQDFKK